MKPIKQIMEENGYEEITKKEYLKLDFDDDGVRFYSDDVLKTLFFKKKPEPKFPKVFRHGSRIIEVTNKDSLNIKSGIGFDETYAALMEKAIKYLEDNQ